jgi:AhpC/TSA family
MSFIRRRSLLVFLGGAGLLTLVAASSRAADTSPQARLGTPAPNFTLIDSNGNSVSLADFKGKTVVLEWTNHECPYVRKHYGGNNMQGLQKKWTAQGVVWLTLVSSHPGAQGFVHGLEANKLTEERGAAPTAVLLDPKGGVGRSYGAQVTPHMYVITGEGALVYMGGIDDKPTTRLEDLKTAKNFVDAALSEVVAGKAVSVKTSRPYGCTIKYSS